jgi:putative transposase
VDRQTWRRKPNRLPADVYVGPRAYFLTAACASRVAHFAASVELVDFCVEALYAAADVERFEVLAYVFMPDHLHLLVEGIDHGSDVSYFMKRFKQQTSYQFRRASGGSLWQKGFYDHVVRREEDLRGVAAYIAQNPVRAGLANEWPDYLKTGGDLLRSVAGGDLEVAATTPTERPKQTQRNA